METSNINLDIFDGEAFCRAACWFDINTLATDSEKRIIWLGKAIDLKAMQLATSVKLLADRWNMTAQTARTRLKEFADAGLIVMERVGTALIITISPEKAHESAPQSVQQPEQLSEQHPEELPLEQHTEPSCEEKQFSAPQSIHVELAKTKLRKCRLKNADCTPHKLKKRRAKSRGK